MFTPLIHDAARAIQPSARGELEITDAIQWLVDGGRQVESHIVRGWWKDTGRLDDMLEANRLILETIERHVEGRLTNAQVDGRVIIEAGAVLENVTVRGPAIIGAGAVLRNAYIGPYTAVGRHCVIEGAEVEHSILLEGSSVRGLDGRMESSLLWRNVRNRPKHRQPRAYRFMVGRQLGDLHPLIAARGHRSRRACSARASSAVAPERGHDVEPTDPPRLDQTDAHAVRCEPPGRAHVITHCAAYTDVDGAEANEATATARQRRGGGQRPPAPPLTWSPVSTD
jgi:hypothetical protein